MFPISSNNDGSLEITFIIRDNNETIDEDYTELSLYEWTIYYIWLALPLLQVGQNASGVQAIDMIYRKYLI